MALTCPKCGRNIPDDAVYCPYCMRGLKPSALTMNVSVAGFLMLIAAIASLIIFLLSLDALLEIYSWYPQLIAQKWILYDQLFTGFSLVAFVFGLIAGVLSLSRKSYSMVHGCRSALYHSWRGRLDHVNARTRLQTVQLIPLLFPTDFSPFTAWNFAGLPQTTRVQMISIS